MIFTNSHTIVKQGIILYWTNLYALTRLLHVSYTNSIPIKKLHHGHYQTLTFEGSFCSYSRNAPSSSLCLPSESPLDVDNIFGIALFDFTRPLSSVEHDYWKVFYHFRGTCAAARKIDKGYATAGWHLSFSRFQIKVPTSTIKFIIFRC